MKYLFYSLLFFSFTACSQKVAPAPIYNKVLPEDNVMLSERIQPHKVRYKKKGGGMTYDLHTIERDGKTEYELYIYFNSDESGTPDKIYFDPNTLAYTGRRLETGAYTIDVRMSPNALLSGELIPKEGSGYEARQYNTQHPHGAFEPAVLNYFLTALPLKEGYKASIPSLDLNGETEILWANIEVVGKEKIKANGKTYDTWKIISDGIRYKTFWLSTEVPYFIKMKTKGTGGGPWVLEEVVH